MDIIYLQHFANITDGSRSSRLNYLSGIQLDFNRLLVIKQEDEHLKSFQL